MSARVCLNMMRVRRLDGRDGVATHIIVETVGELISRRCFMVEWKSGRPIEAWCRSRLFLLLHVHFRDEVTLSRLIVAC